jgi:hypothetical protein
MTYAIIPGNYIKLNEVFLAKVIVNFFIFYVNDISNDSKITFDDLFVNRRKILTKSYINYNQLFSMQY